ncbi:hypothetical protein IFM89_027351, partial [Coptis chinensis]
MITSVSLLRRGYHHLKSVCFFVIITVSLRSKVLLVFVHVATQGRHRCLTF